TSTPALLRPRSVLAHAFCDTTVHNKRTAHTAIRFCISPSMLAMRNGPRQLRLLDPGWFPAEDHAERKMRTAPTQGRFPVKPPGPAADLPRKAYALPILGPDPHSVRAGQLRGHGSAS